MLKSRPLSVGIIGGTIFTFENVGDELPLHQHSDSDNHLTIVAFGKVECFGNPDDPVVLMEAKEGGAIFSFKPDQPHGFRALSPGATIVNLLTGDLR
jgi:quercetin dioxygenase-like cupin family protein